MASVTSTLQSPPSLENCSVQVSWHSSSSHLDPSHPPSRSLALSRSLTLAPSLPSRPPVTACHSMTTRAYLPLQDLRSPSYKQASDLMQKLDGALGAVDSGMREPRCLCCHPAIGGVGGWWWCASCDVSSTNTSRCSKLKQCCLPLQGGHLIRSQRGARQAKS